MKTTFEKVMDILEEGPVLASEVAAELDISSGYASTMLRQLVDIGYAIVADRIPNCPHCGMGKRKFLYEVAP